MRMMMTSLRRGVLSFALIAIVLPLLVIGIGFLLYSKRETIADINHDNMHLARIVREHVRKSLIPPRRILETVAMAAADPDDAPPHLDHLLSRIAARFSFFEDILVLDRRNILRHVGTGSPGGKRRQQYVGRDLFQTAHIALARRTGQLTWSDTFLSPFTDKPTIALILPFEKGMVVGTLNLGELAGIIEYEAGACDDIVYLLSNKGRVIAHPDRSMVVKQADLSSLPIVQAGLAGREGVYEYDINGIGVVGAVAVIRETGWMVIVQRDRSDAFHYFLNMQWMVGVGFLTALLLIAVLVWYVNSRLMQQVAAISAATKTMAGGSFQAVPEYRGRFRELGEMTVNFNAMTEALRERQKSPRLGEERLKLILDNSPYSLYVISADGRALYVNRALETMTGFDREELLSRNLLELIHPEDRDAVVLRRDARLAGREVEPQCQFRIVDKSGNVHWTENQVVLLPWEGTSAIFNFLQDITERRRAEEALRQSERALAEAQRIAHIGSWELDLVENRLAWSTEIYRMFGLRPEEFTATYEAFLDRVHPEDRERVNSAYLGSVQKNLPYDIVHRITRKNDGEVRYVHEVCEHTRDASGRIIRSLGVVHDVTESKLAEDAIAESNRNYRMVVSSISTVIWRLIFDADLRLTSAYFSEVGERLLGLPPGSLRNNLETFLSFVHPDDLPVLRRVLDQTVGNPGVQQSCEYRVRRQDGELRWFLSTGTAVGTPGGCMEVSGTTEDMTERKRSEEERERLIADIQKALSAISRSQKEWQDTFDSITDMISIHDRDFNVIRANKAFSAFFGLSPRDVINRKCYDLMHHGAASPVAGCPHVRSLLEKTHVTEEIVDEKRRKTFRITTFPYFSPTGEILGTIHVARDITEEKEREMSVIMNERLASLGQMASGIAHELNNPLESVVICSEILLLKVGQDKYERDKFEKYLRIIDEEVMRCRNITNNMLSFSRQTGPAKADVDAHLVLDKTIDLVEYQGRLRHVTVVKKYAGACTVLANEGELRQVFLIIVVNALDAMENKGTLTIETGADAGSAWVRISDTGPGMSQEILDKIFQPFFTTKTAKGGTGLGLSIARRIIKAHGGSLTVSSEPGQGARFTVTLPR